ncbi:MAG: type II CAAX endopeptidase family protein [Bacteroidia bacterium]
MQNIEQERYSWTKLLAVLIFIFIYGLLNVVGGSKDIALNMDDQNTINLLKILQVASVVLIFIVPAVLFAIYSTKQGISYLGVSTRPLLKTLLIGGIGMLLAMPLINWLAEINQHMHLPASFSAIETWMRNSEDKATEFTQAFTKGTSISTLILNLFVMAFMAALSEELFFRGILQKLLIECFKNKHVGVWIGAILFSAFHMQFYGFLPRMLMGAYLGYLFVWSGSIWPSIFAHFLNNAIAVYVVWLVNRGVVSMDVDKVGADQQQWLLVLISAIIVIFSLVLIYRTEKKNNVQPLDELN